jgi:hypothetical protein
MQLAIPYSDWFILGNTKVLRYLAKMDSEEQGFKAALEYPLMSAIMNRRSRRIMKGIASVPAGSASYQSFQQCQPLSALEEATLISIVSTSGYSMPDRPFQDEKGVNIQGTPSIHMTGRTAGSADNAQNTHFFLINDSGTYYLRRLPPPDTKDWFTPENLLARAEATKHRIFDHRLEFPREFPYYFDSNRFVSNLPGSTILLPVVDMSIQAINGLMFLLTQPDGFRPVFLDDRNFYRPAGVRKWIKSGFLNPKIKVPLGVVGPFRAHIESDLLLENLMLTLQAMGLGGWIHASFEGPLLLGHPHFSRQGAGLGFRYVTPKLKPLDVLRWGVPTSKTRANPVGLDGLIQAFCPPYYKNMSAAVDALLQMKYGPGGAYNDSELYRKIFKDDLGEKFQKEVPHHSPEIVACVKDICQYIHDTHGRFPAHTDAIHVPGIWLQAHHLDLDYYDKLFPGSYTEMHARHQQLWHRC